MSGAFDDTPYGPSGSKLAYLRGEVETAGPIKLLLLLYNRLIGELRWIRDQLGTELQESVEAPLPSEIGVRFDRCRAILAYLSDSLDPEAGEVAQQLQALYAHFQGRTVEAQLARDGRIIDEMLPNLEKIREGWVEIAGREERV